MIKTRVYEVARELGLDNREVVSKLASLGIQVRNHMSSIDPADADRVKRAIEKEKQQNVVEERIRPTVVRRRSVKREDGEEAAPAAAPVARAVNAGQGAVSVPAGPAPRSQARTAVESRPVPVEAPAPAPRAAREAASAPAPEPVSAPKAAPAPVAA
jgi:translation initiation factor IF-2